MTLVSVGDFSDFIWRHEDGRPKTEDRRPKAGIGDRRRKIGDGHGDRETEDEVRRPGRKIEDLINLMVSKGVNALGEVGR